LTWKRYLGVGGRHNSIKSRRLNAAVSQIFSIHEALYTQEEGSEHVQEESDMNFFEGLHRENLESIIGGSKYVVPEGEFICAHNPLFHIGNRVFHRAHT
jgi:hypothetical protein